MRSGHKNTLDRIRTNQGWGLINKNKMSSIKNLIIAVTCLLTISCKSNSKVDETTESFVVLPTEEKSKVVDENQSITIDSTMQTRFSSEADFDLLVITDTIFDDSFANQPFGLKIQQKKIDFDSLLQTKLFIEYEDVKSKYDTSFTYHFIRIRAGSSKMTFMQSEEGFIHFDRGVIVDSTIYFQRGIHVGMSKKDFMKAFNNYDIKGDVVKVDNQDWSYEHIFYFENDILMACKFENHFSPYIE